MMRPWVIGLSLGAVVILGGLVYLFLQATDDPDPAAAPIGATDRPRPGSSKQAPDPPGSGTAGSGTSGTIAKVDPPRPRVDFTTGGGTVPPAIAAGGGDDGSGTTSDVDVDLDLAMDEANKAYDHSEYEAAVKQALRVLDKSPDNIRMLRIVVSSSCMMGDPDTATKYFGQLPARDQGDMSRRCARYDITLKPTKPALPAGGG